MIQVLADAQRQRLERVFESDQVSFAEADFVFYGQDWSRFIPPNPSAIVFPTSLAEVELLVEFARAERIALVPSGGRTGLSGGATAASGEVVVSFERLNRILDFDAKTRQVKVEPGVITQQLQQFAATQSLYYPVDFASAGASQIGGNIATNAGGIKVLRYGLTRDWVSGLEVVTGAGETLSLNKGLTKNATGLDLRHLFIGSEGILGLITGAWMKVTDAPAPLRVMLLAIPDMATALSVLAVCQAQLALTAFEFFSHKALVEVSNHRRLAKPLSEAPYYVLCEYEQIKGDAEGLKQAEAVYLELAEAGAVSDGVIAQSFSDNARLWTYREGISEAITPKTPYKHDLSVRVSQAPDFLNAVSDVIKRVDLPFEVIWFGHIGDGNVHLNILRPEDWSISEFEAACLPLGARIMQVVERFGGSVSAEHGVGLLKRDYLSHSRAPEEIQAMKAIKGVFDPLNIMNPGKIL
ncbi:MAG: FAD-binding oxidoreductase [Pseudomonadales bacterium]|nr:FAD-binding oxidoreductase [Pseudomonadales bacterium]